MIAWLGARVHLFVRPEYRQPFTGLFRDVLGCTVLERDFGLPHPILFVPFADGSGFSVEFSELAPRTSETDMMDYDRAYRGAWIEFRTGEVERCLRTLREARVPEFRHPGSAHDYFVAPGGQVFRILGLDYQGP